MERIDLSERPFPADAAWAFLLDFYRRNGISEACLLLQDEAGLDVVEMLMLIYADIALGKPLTDKEIATLRAGMSGWRQDAVLPLRSIRRALKPARQDIAESAKEQLRADIKKAELMAERLQVDFAAYWLEENATGAGPTSNETLTGLVPADSRNGAVERALAHIIAVAEAVQAGRDVPIPQPAAPA